MKCELSASAEIQQELFPPQLLNSVNSEYSDPVTVHHRCDSLLVNKAQASQQGNDSVKNKRCILSDLLYVSCRDAKGDIIFNS